MRKSILDLISYPLVKPNANPAAKPPVNGIPEFDMASRI
jgi:hypothetical protein